MGEPLPASMLAVGTHGKGSASIVSRPLPRLRPDYVLVKTSAVALNPTDWKAIEGRGYPGGTVGCDFVGTVVALGPPHQPLKDSANQEDPPQSYRFKVGQRVAGYVGGCNIYEPENGAFAEYLVAKTGLIARVPEHWRDVDAATLGVGITAVGQGMYQSWGLRLPTGKVGEAERFDVLIYGGSSATGALAIQFAKMSGLRILTTCSPKHFDYAKKLGADQMFDYREDNVGKKIREATANQLLHAFDCISTPDSAKICCEALSNQHTEGRMPRYASLLPVKEFPRDDVDWKVTMTSSAPGEKFSTMGTTEEKPEDYVFASRWWRATEKLMEADAFKTHQVEDRKGGLEGVLKGLDDLKQGKVSGVKLVYKI